jgi:hypothetical protein
VRFSVFGKEEMLKNMLNKKGAYMSKMLVLMMMCCWIVAGAAAAVDGGEKAGASAGTVKSRTFNVLNYGAVGDDKTDNTEA